MLTLDRESENFYCDSRAKKESGYVAKNCEYIVAEVSGSKLVRESQKYSKNKVDNSTIQAFLSKEIYYLDTEINHHTIIDLSEVLSNLEEKTQENLKRLVREEIIEYLKGEKLVLSSYEDTFLSVEQILNQKKRAGKRNLRQEFNKLYTCWKEDTASLSSISKKVKHPAYVKIIEIGHDAIPLILKSLLSEPDHWFVALNKIANENPIPYGATFEESVIGWLQWGNKRGLI